MVMCIMVWPMDCGDIICVVVVHSYGLQCHCKCYSIFSGICSVFMLPIFLVVMEAYMLWLLRVVNYCSTWTLYQLLW